MNRFLKNFLVVIGLLFSVSAVAHPGHGTFSGHEVWHYVTSPLHVVIAIAALAVAFTIYRVIKSPNSVTFRK